VRVPRSQRRTAAAGAVSNIVLAKKDRKLSTSFSKRCLRSNAGSDAPTDVDRKRTKRNGTTPIAPVRTQYFTQIVDEASDAWCVPRWSVVE
jgi:hypothetical protein